MSLSDEDVREILRLIDESPLAELRIDTPELHLHVRRGGAVDDEPEPTAPAAGGAGTHPVESPMLGVFYRAPAPGAPPYVDVGVRVQPDTVVCLIEVMKMMNSVAAGVAGTIVEVCAENAELVEHGQPLFRIEIE